MSTIIRSEARIGVRRATSAAFAGLMLLAASTAGGRARADEPPPPAPPADSPLDSLRERFREGMDKYKAGAFADAILIWESIYRELGTDKGYRLAFDLARAYDALGDLIKAADHYETYLDKVTRRRAEGELLEPNVEHQEEVARDRLDKIAALKARIRVKAGQRQPVIVQVDNTPPRVAGFVLYVEPGAHTVTFGTGNDADIRRLTVERGTVVDVEPRVEPPAAAGATSQEMRFETRVEHPFSPLVVWVSAGVAVVSLVVPAITYAHALSVKSDYDSPSTSTSDKLALANDYESARTNAYASIVVPAVLTAAAATFAVWYLVGAKETRIPIPTPSITTTGAALSLGARF